MYNTTTNETDIENVLKIIDGTVVIFYSCLMLTGILCNTCVIFIILSQKSAKNRSPLVVTQFISDLLVCTISIPVTIHHIRFGENYWILPNVFCKFAVYLQVAPVSVSTLTLMALSIERYVSIRCPQPVGKNRIRQYIVNGAAVFCWIFGCSINIPWCLVRMPFNEDDGRQCVELWKSEILRMSFVFSHLFLVYTVPCIVVMVCHLGLREKLTSISLSSRAAKGEMPLPLPLLNLSDDLPFIVIGLATRAETKPVLPYQRHSMSIGDEERPDARLLDVVETSFTTPHKKKLKLKIFVKTRKKENQGRRTQMKATDRLRKTNKTINQPQNKINITNNTANTSTAKSRRRLATVLVITGALTSICWLPYVICVICINLCCNQYDPIMHVLQRFSLFLGHSHSLVNPIIYWTMNQESLTRCSCPCNCFKRCRMRQKNPFYRNNSSTNEMALGPFHPRYTKPPIPRKNLRRSSSCYLY